MAVPEQTPFIEYTANGTTTVYPLTFDCDKSEYLIVSLDGDEAPVGSWSLTGGSITFNSAPANGVLITIERNTPFRRTTEYQSYNNSFRPSPVNKDFDLIWWKLQELGYRDQVIWLALVKEIADRIAGDDNLQNQINTIDEWLADLQQNVNENTNDIAQLVNDLSKEIADRITGDQILKDMFISMIDEAINEGTINALAITHLDSLEALDGVTNVWDGRTIYIKDLGNYRYDALTTSWVKAYQDADNVRYGSKTQKEVNDDQKLTNDQQALFNEKFNKFKQPEAGGVERDLSVRARDIQFADDYATLQQAVDAKRSSTIALELGIKQYTLTSTLNISQYAYIQGKGFYSRIKCNAGTGVVYNAVSVADDHAQRALRDFQIVGDGTIGDYLTPKNGTTIGYSVFNTGHYAETHGLLLNGHDTGMKLEKTYTNRNTYNYYRACKTGLHLKDITSHREESPYIRYCSSYGILIEGSAQNVTIAGGAIEGNRGTGIAWKNIPANTAYPKLILEDLYFESVGDLAANVGAVDIQDYPKMHVECIGGNYWNNILSGITTGPYRWGNSVTFRNPTMNGYHYSRNMRIIGGYDSALHNTADIQATAVALGLTEPTMMLEYSPTGRVSGLGPIFQVPLSGRPNQKLPITNEVTSMVYPHVVTKSASTTLTENTALNYGDGSWTDIALSATGSSSTNFAELSNLPDSGAAYIGKVFVCLLCPATDCQIGFSSSGTKTTHLGYFALKANKKYRMLFLSNRTDGGTHAPRIFSLNGAVTISYLPIYHAKFTDTQAAIAFANMFCTGAL